MDRGYLCNGCGHRPDGPRRIGDRLGGLFISLLGGALDGAVVPVDDGTDGIAEVTQQVPAIGHLDRFRRALTNSVRVGTGAVACDHLDAGMLAQPGGEGLGLPIREQVHHLVAFEVDQDGSVAMTPPPGPVVHSEHLERGRCDLELDRACHHAQQRVRTAWDGQSFRQSRGGFTAQSKCDVALEVTEPGRPPRGCWGDRAKTFGKGLAATCGVETPEPPR